MDRVRKGTADRQVETWTGEQVIAWLYERCGRSEHAHATMKRELAGGRLPCGEFGKNAAWWWMMILAFNLNAAMKRLVLGENWVHRGLKAIRFHIIHIAGRLIRGANTLKIRVCAGIETLSLLIQARGRLKAMADPARV